MKQNTVDRIASEQGGLRSALEGRKAEIKRCHTEIERLRAALTEIAQASLQEPEAEAWVFGHIAERTLEQKARDAK